MALSDRIDSTPQRITGLPCSVGALEDALEGPEAEAFASMMYQLGWSGARIYAAVQQEAKVLRESATLEAEAGNLEAAAANLEAAAVYANLGKQTVNRHRSRGCRCYK